MYHTFIRYISAFLLILLTSTASVFAQPCADTQPAISGSQAVTNSQLGVIYSTPNTPGHTYSWAVTGGVITSGAGTSQITVTWGPVGAGTVSVMETNPALNCSTSVVKNVKIQPFLVAYFYYTNTSCYGDEISFFANKGDSASLSDASTPIASYEWDFGDGNTSNLANPTHIYLPPWNSTWNIRLIVTNTAGYKDTIYDAVYVNPFQFIPVAAFTDNIPNCTYQAVTFDGSISTTPIGTDSINDYHWDFGDPSSPTNIVNGAFAKTPSHVFTAPGTYTVTLTVTNARYCTNTTTRSITILPSVPESRYAYSAPTCVNNPTSFTDQSITPAGHNITNWEWRFGDGSMPVNIAAPASPNVSHVYPGLGPYPTWLIITNDLGCLDTIIKQISLTPSPIAAFSNISNCFGDSVKFTSHSLFNGGPAITTYDWNFGDPLSGFNTSNNVNPSHLFSAPGDYNITLIIQNQAGCPDTLIKPIHIFSPPNVEYTWNLGGGQNNMVQFHLDRVYTPIAMIGNMVQWNFGDGSYGYGYDPVHIYPAGGLFNVTLSVTDTNGCQNSVTHQILVPSLPLAFFSTDSPKCLGDFVCMTDLSTAATPPFGWITTWIWNFGDGSPNDTILFPALPNVCHKYATADTFAVTLKVFDNFGNSSSYTRDVIVLPNPVANFQFTTGCAGQVVSFTDASTANGGGNVISYNWNFGDPASGINNTSGDKDPIHTFMTGGTTYNVRLIISNFNGCVDTIIKPVPVLASPALEFTHDTACLLDVVHYSADTLITLIDSIATWQWNFGDGSPVVTDPVTTAHLYTLPGTYITELTVMDKHGCISKKSHPVIVNPLPIAGFSWAAQSCQGSSVQFTDQSLIPAPFTGYIAKWEWDFGDGSPIQTITIPTSPNVLHSFPSTSITYNVKLKVWSSDSCTKEIIQTINLIATPVANFSSSSVTCEGQSIQYTDISQTNGGGSIVSWSWNFNDPTSGINNTSPLPNPVHTFLTAGNYNVSLIVTNASGCKDTIVKTDTVRQLPIAAFTADTACLDSPTTFINTSVPNSASIITYAWDFGDGANSALQNPTHTYSNPGVFTVTLQITNSNGCIKSISHQVLVNPLPIAAFGFSTPNCLGAPVQFTNMSTTVPGYLGSIVRWFWDFGDGNTSNIPFPASPNVSHTYNGPGLSHTVRLTVVTNDSCQSFIEHVVTSIPSPIASFSTPTSNCATQSVAFTDLSQQNGGGNIITWSWDFGDPGSGMNNFSPAQNPVHFFSAAGTYQVTLIVVNASNCTDTVQSTVTIIGLPMVNFTADTACLTHPTTFTFIPNPSSPGTITQWAWEFGDGGTSTNTNPTHIYLSSGVFNVKLTVTTNEGCPRDTILPVLVIPSPISAFSASAPTCAGDSVQFVNLSSTSHGSIVTWEWTFGDGGTAIRTFPASPNVNHLYATGGTYQVSLKITTSDNCIDTQINPVIIQSAPLANFDFPTVRCADMPVQFNDLTQPVGGSPITQWLWNFDDPGSGIGNTSNIQSPVHNFSTSGSFDVVLTSWNASGCMDTIMKTVSVNAAPLAQFTADTSCIGSDTQFTDGSTTPSGTLTAWLWNFGEPGSGTFNTSTLQNPTHSYASSGNYFVTLMVTNSNTCTRDTIIPITVYPKPNAMFEYAASCVNSETQFTDLSLAPGSMITSWFWDFGDGTGTSTIENPTYTYTAGGTYSVKLRVTNLSNCTDSVIMSVVARPAPIANFNYTGFFCPQGQVNFQDESVGVGAAITERLWIFEPGYTSTLVNPTHIFSVTDTTLAVTLIVTDNFGCKDTIVDSVYVKPGFSFSFNNDTVCFKNPTHFTPVNQTPGDTLYSVRWDFGDPASGPNNISYAYNAVHTYTQPGSYAVKLRAVDSDNCSDSIYKDIIVHALPAPAFSFVSTPCDSIIRFNEASTSGSGTISSWEWNFGDGSPALIIPAPGSGDTSHQYVIGTYPVLLKVTNSFGCVDTLSKSVELYPCILANFTHDTSLVCARYPVSFSDSSLPVSRINQWHWLFGDGLDTTYIIHTGNLVHKYADAGTYNVSLIINATVSGKSFTDTMTQVVTVHPTPLTAFSNIAVCANKITLFSDTSNTYGSPVTNWSWNFGHPTSGTADTSTFTNPSHKYDIAGDYDVKLIVMNRFGCKDSLIKTTRVHALPAARFQSSLACSSNPTYFTDKTSVGDTTLNLWHWNFGDGSTKKDTSMIQNPKYEYKDGGDYVVRMIVRDRNGCYDTVDSLVSVFVSPFSAFSITDNVNGMTGKVLFNNQSTGADVYYWDFGNGKFSTDENPIVTYSEDGTYLVMLISRNQNECSDTTFYKYEVLFKGLYIPNAFAPTSSNFAVMLFKPIGVNLKTLNIEVFDNWGHLVWSSKALDLQGRPTEGWDGRDLNGNLMPSGTYMWKANAMFIDGSEWQGSDIGKGGSKTMGTVTLIR